MSIAIVIPAYNEQADIIACLDAIALQQLPPNEVILVDNNSTDQTVAIAKRYPFVTILHEPRQGVVYARDTGFNAVNSDIIGRIDVDTCLPPDWTLQVQRIFQNPEIGAVTGSIYYKDMPARPVNHMLDILLREAANLDIKDMKFLLGANMALRTDAWRAVRGSICHSRDFHEDIDLAIHLSEHGYAVAFDRRLLAGMSSRRLDDNFSKFYRYLRMTDRTYTKHGIDSQSIKIPGFTLLTAYPGLKLLRKAYNPQTQRFSIHKLLAAVEVRKNPNDDVPAAF